jgi:hypothetical protein
MLIDGGGLHEDRFDIGKISRAAIGTFPSFYQLIPFKNPFLNDLNNEKVDLFQDLRWDENDRHAQLLLDGRRFNQELGNTLSVETLCFFGCANHDLVRALRRRRRWENVEGCD